MKLLNLIALSLLLTGCIGPGITPPKALIDDTKQVYIVAMESPPLDASTYYNPVIVESSNLTFGSREFAVYNTIAILLSVLDASKWGAEISESFQAVLDRDAPWSPTQALANEISTQLNTQGLKTTVDPLIKPIAGVKNPTYTFLMENWLAPIRAWYNDTDPVSEYRHIQQDNAVYVIEVGIMNYSIENWSTALTLQVAMKLIDPASGKVIGQARATNIHSRPHLGSLHQTFSGNASRFKQIFRKTGRELTAKCLVKLGLIQSSDQSLNPPQLLQTSR